MGNKSEATFHGAESTAERALELRQSQLKFTAFPEPEAETVGDWVNKAGQIVEMHLTPQVQDAIIRNGISELVEAAGTNSRDHGFHEDWPSVNDIDSVGAAVAQERQIGLAIVEKLALIHEEVSEALGEIRSGHEATEVYYRDKDSGEIESDQWFHPETGAPMGKPEGFGVELADAVIRIADLAFLTGVDLGSLIMEKHAYNKTRPAKHGRKF